MRKVITIFIFVSFCAASSAQTQDTVHVGGTIINIFKNADGSMLTPISPTTVGSPLNGRYNIIIMGDAFKLTSQDQSNFNIRAEQVVSGLLGKEPYLSNGNKFNFFRVNVISQDSKIDVPVGLTSLQTINNAGIPVRNSQNALNTLYGDNIFPVSQTASTTPGLIHGLANRILPEYNAIVVISNTTGEVRVRGTCVYGICFLGVNDIAAIIPHEMAHHIGRLGDEYENLAGSGTNSIPYTRCEPVFPNLTKCPDINSCSIEDECSLNGNGECNCFDRSAKIANWISLGITNQRQGGGYHSVGLYRPQFLCNMRDNFSGAAFCPVCNAELIKNFCSTPKPPHITTNAFVGPKYMEILPGQQNTITPPSQQIRLVQTLISINYLFEETYDFVPCESDDPVIFTAWGEPGATFSWYQVERNEVGIVSYKPLVSNVPGHPEQYQTTVNDTLEIACTQTQNNCISDYRYKRVVHATIWFLDNDDDRYYSGTGVYSCAKPDGNFKNTGLLGGGDCDDNNSSVHPGIIEISDCIDNNCDGLINEGFVSTKPDAITVSGVPVPFCTGTIATITLTVSGGTLAPGAEWVWYKESCGSLPNRLGQGPSITVTQSTTTRYFVRAELCANFTLCETITVFVNTFSDASIVNTSTNPLCEGGSIKLEPATPGPITRGGIRYTNVAFTWIYPDGTEHPFPSDSRLDDVKIDKPANSSNAGVYTLLTTNSGCVASRSVLIKLESAISNNTIEGDQTVLCSNIPNPLPGSDATGPEQGLIYEWQQSTTGPTATNFSPAPGTNNQANYSPAQLPRTTWFRRTCRSASCPNSPRSISNVVEVTVINGPINTNNTSLEGSTSVCSGRTVTYTFNQPNAVTYIWNVPGNTNHVDNGNETRIRWQNIGNSTVTVIATDCSGNSVTATANISVRLCPPPDILICNLRNAGRALCDLTDICARLGLICSSPRMMYNRLSSLRFRPDDYDIPMRVKILAAVDPERSPRILGSVTYSKKPVKFPIPANVKLRKGEKLWIQFEPLTRKPLNKEVRILVDKQPDF